MIGAVARRALRAETMLASRALRAAAARRDARAVAWLLAAHIRSAPFRPLRPTARHAKRALILPKGGFTADMYAVGAACDELALSSLDRTLVKAIGRAFLPAHINDFTYRSDNPDDERAMRGYRTFWRDVWMHLGRLRDIDVVLSGNFVYWAEQELAHATTELGVPFAVLFKEGLNTPALERFWAWVYQNWRVPFRGARILTYSETARALLTRAKMVDQAACAVTGMPRLDALLRSRSRAGGARRARARLLFFAFGEKTALPAVDERHGRTVPPRFRFPPWRQLVAQTYARIRQLAERRADVDVVVKAKSGVPTMTKAIEEHLTNGGCTPPNLEVVYGGDAGPHIEACSVACGFISTALLEALAAGKAVVVPRFAEAARPDASDLLLDLGEAVHYARSPDALSAALDSSLSTALGRSSAVEEAGWQRDVAPLLRRWLGNGDGGASERVAREVLDLC